MSIIRLIHIKLDPSETDRAMQVWKKECAPLMIRQKRCISEKLLSGYSGLIPAGYNIEYCVNPCIAELAGSYDEISEGSVLHFKRGGVTF